MSKLIFNGKTIATLAYNVFENDNHYFVKAEYSNGRVLTNPYLIALSLCELNFNMIKEMKGVLMEKKLCQYFRNEIPYFEITYLLTGGHDVWKSDNINIKWNKDKAIEFWKDELDDLLKDCFTLYDLIIVFLYFKHELVVKNFGKFADFLSDKKS